MTLQQFLCLQLQLLGFFWETAWLMNSTQPIFKNKTIQIP